MSDNNVTERRVFSAPEIPPVPAYSRKLGSFSAKSACHGGLALVALMFLSWLSSHPSLHPKGPSRSAVLVWAPNAEHWFGTDHLGRDIRGVLYGARTSLMVGLLSVAMSLVIGILIGSWLAITVGAGRPSDAFHRDLPGDAPLFPSSRSGVDIRSQHLGHHFRNRYSKLGRDRPIPACGVPYLQRAAVCRCGPRLRVTISRS